jgi:pimeloyl-ACP methyl ester carboxylesterase
VVRVLGGSAEQVPDRYALVDPEQLAQPRVPTTILHGRRDSLVPLSMSQRYVVGRPNVELVELDCGHFELIDPLAAAFDLVLDFVQSSP